MPGSQGVPPTQFRALWVFSVYSCCHKVTVWGFLRVDDFCTYHFTREVIPIAYDPVREEIPRSKRARTATKKEGQEENMKNMNIKKI